MLDGLDRLKVCVAYELGGERFRHLPFRQSALWEASPVYEELPGWEADTSGVTSADDLPAAAADYLSFIEAEIGVPVRLVRRRPRPPPVPGAAMTEAVSNVLAERYASEAMIAVWSPERRVALERRLWVAVLRASAGSASTCPTG